MMRRAMAVLVLVVAAYLVFHFVIGLVITVLTIIAVVAVIAAVIWAVNQLA